MSAGAYAPGRFNHAELINGRGARLNSVLALQVGGQAQGQQPCLVKQSTSRKRGLMCHSARTGRVSE